MIEPHYTVQELAEMLKVSVSTARRLVQDQPDVLTIGKRHRLGGRRSYTTLRIPEGVLHRVIKELTNEPRAH